MDNISIQLSPSAGSLDHIGGGSGYGGGPGPSTSSQMSSAAHTSNFVGHPAPPLMRIKPCCSKDDFGLPQALLTADDSRVPPSELHAQQPLVFSRSLTVTDV